MLRYIALLLITGTVLAQNGLDTLVLKNGTKYHGEFLRTESKYDKYKPMVYCGPKNEESLRIIPVEDVERLQLKDGIFVINEGKINYNFLRSQLSTSEKAVIDAKKWTTYPLLAGLTFFSSIIGILVPGVYLPNLSSLISAIPKSSFVLNSQNCRITLPFVDAP